MELKDLTLRKITRPAVVLGATAWPRISLVTPSFSQAQFLEATICSVLHQDYPNLEYFVIDGGSTDGSQEIIRRYAARLAGWVSEPDQGQYDAIQKGFERSSGEIMAWINSDDQYCPWALRTAASIFASCPEIEWLTTCTPLTWNESGDPVVAEHLPGFARGWFYRGWHMEGSRAFRGWIQQESTFWRRSLWQKAGAHLARDLKYAGDLELWARFWQYTDLVATPIPLGGFRRHGTQKTKNLDAYLAEARQVLSAYRPRWADHPSLLGMLQAGLNRTGWGTEWWGCKLSRVEYDDAAGTWVLNTRRVL